MRLAQPTLTVYFDGSCPLCRAEIGLNSAQKGADRIRFQDVAATGERFAEPLGVDLAEEQALARFHLRLADGTLVSGAAAFVQIWMQLPAWRWAARLGSLPGVMPLLELAYRMFLPIRPLLSRVVGAVLVWRRRA